MLRPSGRAFVQSGNIRNPQARPSEWILDETVWAIHEVATGLVRNDPRYAAYRPLLDDETRMQAHVAYRDPGLPAGPAARALPARASRRPVSPWREVTVRSIEARVEDWFEFLSAYHEAVLGWLGLSVKVDGERAQQAKPLTDRLALIRQAMDTRSSGAARRSGAAGPLHRLHSAESGLGVAIAPWSGGRSLRGRVFKARPAAGVRARPWLRGR